MTTATKPAAEIRYSTDGPTPVVELRVPRGTRLADLGSRK